MHDAPCTVTRAPDTSGRKVPANLREGLVSAVGRGLGELGSCAYTRAAQGAFGVLWG
jgi:hypothetical protein